MKSYATSFATVRRLGLTSCAIMLVEMSIAIMMSMPSVSLLRRAFDVCGRASTMTKSEKLMMRRRKGR